MAEQATIRRHWWVAGLTGLLAPGLGQLYTGRARLAGWLMAAFVTLFALFQSGIPSTFVGFVVLFGGATLVSWGGAVEAVVHAWRHTSVTRRSFHRWYIYVVYAVGFTLITTGINMGFLAPIGQPSMFGAYKPYSVSSVSSVPNLMKGEYFWVETARGATKAELSGHVGAFVLVSWPYEPGDYVYRLVAVGGQSVAVREGAVFVDGKRLPQRELCTTSDPETGRSASRWAETLAGKEHVVQYLEGLDAMRNYDEAPVPEGHFFVLGDSRDNANDSRFRGAVADGAYAGRALFILWSDDWSRIGKSLLPNAPIEKAAVCPEAAK